MIFSRKNDGLSSMVSLFWRATAFSRLRGRNSTLRAARQQLARSLDRQLMLASVDFFNVVRLFVLMNATRYFEPGVVEKLREIPIVPRGPLLFNI